MSARARLLSLAFAAILPASPAHAQVTWQPATPPAVTAEHESWFQAGDPIVWSGAYYYQTGPRQFFNGDQMVRTGSFRGIPLYTDATLEPFSIVFVPVGGGLMQPYERRRSGALAGTTGATAPSFPTEIATEGLATDRSGLAVDIAQAPGAPARARAYDLAPSAPPSVATPPLTSVGPPASRPALGTSGRITAITPTTPSGRRTGRAPVNTIWVNYNGRRWFADGLPIAPRQGELTQRGTYYGFPVFTRAGDDTTIYIPSVHGGLVTPFRLKPEA